MAYTTINDPSAHFQTVLYTGDGNSTQAITNGGNSNLQPDWIWTKQRSHSVGHNLVDSNRGASKALFSEGTDAEDTGGNISSFNSDGFTTTDANRTNQDGRTFAAWQWKANGGTTTNNTDGDQASTVQANTTAGFSIATYSGDGSGNFTVGHGLGSTLDAIIVKRKDDTSNWYVWHKNLTSGAYVVYLNANNAEASESTIWNSTVPTSSVFTIGTDANLKTTGDYVAYCFVGKQGYSKFGGYTGNGNNGDGSFIYTGFKPKWLMIKRAVGGTQNWHMSDTSMKNTNENTQRLLPSLTAAEETRPTTDSINFLSNGFKCNSGENILNDNGDTYIYWAFAENPFVSSNGIPATAR